MSNFLANLVRRSRGSLDSVQPPMPSIYEPRRREDDLLSARPEFSGRNVSADSAIETRLEGETGDASINDLYNRLRAQSGNPLERWEQSAEHREKSIAADGVSPLDALQPKTDLLSFFEGMRPKPGALSESRADSQAANRTDAPRDSTPQPEGIRQNGSSRDWSLEVTRTTLVRPRSIPDNGESYRSRRVLNPSQTSRGDFEPSVVVHSPTSAVSAIRPPISRFARQARNPEVASASSPPRPAIQVTIGRVEVRAVFPEAPVRRPSPNPSQSTVSLDDYLNQRHRGKR